MKLFVLFVFCVFAASSEADEKVERNFKLVGNFKISTTPDGHFKVKNYFLSAKDLSWKDAAGFCVSDGKRLMKLDSQNELKFLLKTVKKNRPLFDAPIHLDATNEFKGQTENSCLSFFLPVGGRLEMKEEDCNADSRKFLCQETLETNEFVDLNKIETETLDVKATFFSYVGDYDSGDVKKSYYINKFTGTKFNAKNICKSFGMILSSPQSQSEYDNLQKLLGSHSSDFTILGMIGQRSEAGDWLNFGQPLKYKIDFATGEPDNKAGNEDCLGFVKDGDKARMNDIDCASIIQFVCEYSFNDNPNAVDVSKLPDILVPLTDYHSNVDEKTLFKSVAETDWVQAQIACKTVGMQLFSPENEHEDLIVRNLLFGSETTPNAIHVGVGIYGHKFYSMYSGNVLDLDTQLSHSGHGSDNCLHLKKGKDENFTYAVTDCVNIASHFVCQRVKA